MPSRPDLMRIAFAAFVLAVSVGAGLASPVADSSDVARALGDCGEKVGGPLARKTLALSSILSAVDRDCAREEADLVPFEEESLQARQQLLLRYLEPGADPRRDLPPACSGTGVKVIR